MVAIVDDAFARRYFPGEEAIGQRIDIGNGTDGFYEVVGVVGNVRYGGLDAAPEPTMYVPYGQDVFSTMWIVARTDGNPTAIASNVRATAARSRSEPSRVLDEPVRRRGHRVARRSGASRCCCSACSQ